MRQILALLLAKKEIMATGSDMVRKLAMELYVNASSNAKLESFHMITRFRQHLLEPSSRLERFFQQDSSQPDCRLREVDTGSME